MSTENTVTLIGNLADDPEIRHTSTGKRVANLRVAVNSRFFNRATNEWDSVLDGFFTVVAWNGLVDGVSTLSKGDRVHVVGPLRTRSFEDSNGNTQWRTEINADEVSASLRFVGSDEPSKDEVAESKAQAPAPPSVPF